MSTCSYSLNPPRICWARSSIDISNFSKWRTNPDLGLTIPHFFNLVCRRSACPRPPHGYPDPCDWVRRSPR